MIICTISLFALLLHFCCFVQHKDYPILPAPDSELGAAEQSCLSWWSATTHTHTDNFLCLAALACSIWSSTMTHHTHTHTYCIALSYFPSTGLLHLAKNMHSDQAPCIPTHCTQLLFPLSDWLHSPCTHSHIVDNCMYSYTHDGEPLPLSLPDLACSILPCTFSDHSPHTHWLTLQSFLSPVSGWLLLVVVQTWTGTSHMHYHTNYPELLSSSVPGRFGCSVLPDAFTVTTEAHRLHIVLSPATRWLHKHEHGLAIRTPIHTM